MLNVCRGVAVEAVVSVFSLVMSAFWARSSLLARCRLKTKPAAMSDEVHLPSPTSALAGGRRTRPTDGATGDPTGLGHVVGLISCR